MQAAAGRHELAAGGGRAMRSAWFSFNRQQRACFRLGASTQLTSHPSPAGAPHGPLAGRMLRARGSGSGGQSLLGTLPLGGWQGPLGAAASLARAFR